MHSTLQLFLVAALLVVRQLCGYRECKSGLSCAWMERMLVFCQQSRHSSPVLSILVCSSRASLIIDLPRLKSQNVLFWTKLSEIDFPLEVWQISHRLEQMKSSPPSNPNLQWTLWSIRLVWLWLYSHAQSAKVLHWKFDRSQLLPRDRGLSESVPKGLWACLLLRARACFLLLEVCFSSGYEIYLTRRLECGWSSL